MLQRRSRARAPGHRPCWPTVSMRLSLLWGTFGEIRKSSAPSEASRPSAAGRPCRRHGASRRQRRWPCHRCESAGTAGRGDDAGRPFVVFAECRRAGGCSGHEQCHRSRRRRNVERAGRRADEPFQTSLRTRRPRTRPRHARKPDHGGREARRRQDRQPQAIAVLDPGAPRAARCGRAETARCAGEDLFVDEAQGCRAHLRQPGRDRRACRSQPR